MTDMLSFLNERLDELAIPYEFGEWTAEVSYPYFVGSFQEADFRFEDNRTDGVFTLDGWARDDKAALMEAADAIQAAFADLQMVEDGSAYFVRYGGAQSVPTGEADLYRVTITLYTYQWKGDNS